MQNINLQDLIQLLVQVQSTNINKEREKEEKLIYTARELERLYPKLFSKYKLSQAIKNDGLKYFVSGRERFFKKEDIENWINSKGTN